MQSMIRRAAVCLPFALALATPAAFAEQTFKHPQTGHDCVTSKGYERSSTGKHYHFQFENICGRAFSLRIKPGDGSDVRGTGIGPGSPGAPSKSSITCAVNDRCESGKWYYN